jgi:hypothetical protein
MQAVNWRLHRRPREFVTTDAERMLHKWNLTIFFLHYDLDDHIAAISDRKLPRATLA